MFQKLRTKLTKIMMKLGTWRIQGSKNEITIIVSEIERIQVNKGAPRETKKNDMAQK